MSSAGSTTPTAQPGDTPDPRRPAPPEGASRARTAMAATGLLREPAWACALLVVVALSVAFVFLGRWQYQRHEARSLRSDRVAQNYDAPPVPLTDVLPAAGTDAAAVLPRTSEWRPVRVTGRYLAGEGVLVRNRPLRGTPGHEVVVPLELEGVGRSGTRLLLVDRGWVPTGATGAAPDRVPPPPAGRVEVVVRLRPGEGGTSRVLPRGQVARIEPQRISADLGRPVLGTYGVLERETPAPASAPTALPRPDLGTDINLPYAVQWYAFALAAYVLLGWGAVREVRSRRARQGAGTASGTPTTASSRP